MTNLYQIVVRSADGDVEYSAQGREGAMEAAIRILAGYRRAVERGSGMLYGNPQTLGWIEVDGVSGLVSVTDQGMTDAVIRRIDRMGVDGAKAFEERVAAEVEAEMFAPFDAQGGGR